MLEIQEFKEGRYERHVQLAGFNRSHCIATAKLAEALVKYGVSFDKVAGHFSKIIDSKKLETIKQNTPDEVMRIYAVLRELNTDKNIRFSFSQLLVKSEQLLSASKIQEVRKSVLTCYLDQTKLRRTVDCLVALRELGFGINPINTVYRNFVIVESSYRAPEQAADQVREIRQVIKNSDIRVEQINPWLLNGQRSEQAVGVSVIIPKKVMIDRLLNPDNFFSLLKDSPQQQQVRNIETKAIIIPKREEISSKPVRKLEENKLVLERFVESRLEARPIMVWIKDTFGITPSLDTSGYTKGGVIKVSIPVVGKKPQEIEKEWTKWGFKQVPQQHVFTEKEVSKAVEGATYSTMRTGVSWGERAALQPNDFTKTIPRTVY